MINSASRSATQSQEQALSDAQPTEAYIQRLVARCWELTCQYQTTPAIVQERAWWKALYRAGGHLRDILEAHQERWESLYLSDAEVEHAHLTLLHVNYFFEPGQLAEMIFTQQGWVWSDDEQEA